MRCARGCGGCEGVAFAWDLARPPGTPASRSRGFLHGRTCSLAVVLSVGFIGKDVSVRRVSWFSAGLACRASKVATAGAAWPKRTAGMSGPAARSTIEQSDGPRCCRCQTAAIIIWQIGPGLLDRRAGRASWARSPRSPRPSSVGLDGLAWPDELAGEQAGRAGLAHLVHIFHIFHVPESTGKT